MLLAITFVYVSLFSSHLQLYQSPLSREGRDFGECNIAPTDNTVCYINFHVHCGGLYPHGDDRHRVVYRPDSCRLHDVHHRDPAAVRP